MSKRSAGLLVSAVILHFSLLVGWRWQQPLVPYFFDATVMDGRRGLDFYSIYQAGYNARQGWDIYEGDPTRVEVIVPYFTPYRYLPSVAYSVGAALSLFSPLTAYKSWVVITELTLLLCIYLTHRLEPDRDRFARLATMWLVFTPFYLELFMGQFSMVQGALIFAMLILAAGKDWRSRSVAVGAVWLTSILWKINTIVFAPVFLRLRQWRTLIVVAGVVTLVTVPYFIAFPAHLRDFLLNNFGNTAAGHELGNLGFRQLVYEVLAALGAATTVQRAAQQAAVGVFAGVAVLLTFLPIRSPDSGLWTWDFRPQTIDLLTLWLTTFFLISPQIWEHHYVMLLPVLVMTYWQRPNELVALIWLLLALPTPFGFIGLQPMIAANHDLRAFPLQPAWMSLVQHASKAVPTLLLYGYYVWAVVARPPALHARGPAPLPSQADRL